MGVCRWGSGWWSTAFVVGCGCLIALITYGLRTSFGLFAAPIGEGRGWSPEVFALAIAIQNLVWGIGQPFAGAVADRYGSARILAAGGVVYAAGVALMAVSPTPLAFNLTAGVLVGLGLSGASFTIVIAALGGCPDDKSSQAMGSRPPRVRRPFISRPGQASVRTGGRPRPLLAGSMWSFPLSLCLKGGEVGLEGAGVASPHAVRRASVTAATCARRRILRCGFHVAFITTTSGAHLDVAWADARDAHRWAAVAAWAPGANRLFTSLAPRLGFLAPPSKRQLPPIYLSRPLHSALITLPPTRRLLAFAAAMGVLCSRPSRSLWLSPNFGDRDRGPFWDRFLSHNRGVPRGLVGASLDDGSFLPICGPSRPSIKPPVALDYRPSTRAELRALAQRG